MGLFWFGLVLSWEGLRCVILRMPANIWACYLARVRSGSQGKVVMSIAESSVSCVENCIRPG